MGRESNVRKPRSLQYWPNCDGAKRLTTMVRVMTADEFDEFTVRLRHWYLDGLMTRAAKRNERDRLTVSTDSAS